MKARVIIEFTDTFIEMIKLESGYTSPEAIAAYLKGLYTSEYTNVDTAGTLIKNCIVEVTE